MSLQYCTKIQDSVAQNLGTYEVIASDLSVRTGPGENYRRKTYNELTVDAKKHDYDKDGCLNKGTRVTVSKWNGNWAKIPSGWVSGDYLKRCSDMKRIEVSISYSSVIITIIRNCLSTRETSH